MRKVIAWQEQEKTLETLSQREVQQLSETANGKTYQLFRQ
ncbi:hypothetical protein AAIH03_35725, partial [Pseudomonas aeruginosa]